MDALEILSNLDNVFPYFQPIFSADEQLIIAYEVLGRYISEGNIISLGPFFQDQGIPDEYKFEVDMLIVRKALDKAVDLEEEVSIFFNRSVDLLMYESGEPFLNELLQYEKKGLSLKRIVLEISIQNGQGETLHQFEHLLHYYRTYGIKIALTNIGSTGHFERIIKLEPDILKISLEALRSTATGVNFHDVLFTLSLLARKIGSTLLFEQIEMSYQLQFAWKNGGHYYQGFYLQPPAGEFLTRDFLKSRLKEKFHDFISYEKRKIEAFFLTTKHFQAKVQEILMKNKRLEYEELLHVISKELDKAAFRMYICNEDGFQTSANFFKEQHGWVKQDEYKDKNWSWRPYFLANIIKMRDEQKGILSDLYRDIESGEPIRTFSYPINAHEYLFIDIAYDYLFEHDQLL
ncbi:EAL domain-containing protein [Bacillus rubiinfantis]|uniref:EAL domain-containing protein n=1 Tax=Bacillus rubiinfantis TaxID=1499680 RepID=UPI0005A7ECC8|nr:EAL-associated domain-containing protein [Bacillus rubiinfantis]